MKTLLVLASFGVLMVAAKPQYQHQPPKQQNVPQQQTAGSSPYGFSPVGNAFGSPYGAGGAGSSPVIHKHVYVHVPPPERRIPKPKKPYVPPPPPQKHYKIIFIKAPTPPPPEVPEIPQLAPPPETKTLVYVLVKKPEPMPPIHIPTPAPTKPSKPEVYFIRYKSPKDGGPPDLGDLGGLGGLGGGNGYSNEIGGLSQEYGVPGGQDYGSAY